MEGTNELINDLYAIRAGMCVLSSEKKKNDAMVEQAKNAYEENQKVAEQKLQESKARIAEAEEELQNSKDNKSYDRTERLFFPLYFLKVLAVILLYILSTLILVTLAVSTLYLAVLLVGGLVTYFFDLNQAWLVTGWGWYTSWLLSLSLAGRWAAFILIPIAGFWVTVIVGIEFYHWIFDNFSIRDFLSDSWFDLRMAFDSLFSAGGNNRRCHRAEDSLENAKYSYKKAEENFHRALKELEAEYNKKRKRANARISDLHVFYSALEELYKDILDPRDWKFVDYIIYSFETGRAESLKEALQLADREDQTQRIIDTMQEASKRICDTIKYNADRIQENLQRNFDMIANKVAEESAKICNRLDAVGGKLDKLNDGMNRLNAGMDRLNSNVEGMHASQSAYLSRISRSVNIASEFAKNTSESSSKLASDMSLLKDQYRAVNHLY